jgi:hypothetical protein
MKKTILAIAIAASSAFSVITHAAAAIDPCLSAHERMGDLRKAVAAEVRVEDRKNESAVPTAEFERVWFEAKRPAAREWFDTNEAPKVRAISGNVDAAFEISFANWKHDSKVRDAMTNQYRKMRQQYLHNTSDAAVSAAQSKVNDSCPMDVANQALRVGVGAALLPITLVAGNIDAARNESGAIAQALRGTIGISIKDIKKHGVLGGPNSVFHCPFGGC